MSTYKREWLRSFLNLDARAIKESIPLADIERQETTVLRAAEMLDSRPGILLADEVGMGKTYEALGLAAIARHERPRSRIVIITPTPTLNEKWTKEIERFKSIFDFGSDVYSVHNLPDFMKAVRKKHSVVVAPVTMFQSGHGSGDQTYMLSLYFHWKELHGHTVNAIMDRFREGEHQRVDVREERFLGLFTLEQIEPNLRQAFCRPNRHETERLNDLYEESGLAAFEDDSSEAVHKALGYARFVLAQQFMPMIDLLIVDEAHKLKNPSAMRSRAMHHAFNRCFRKAVFLTATPFQLEVGELKEIFRLFGRAKSAPKNFLDQIEKLLESIGEYQNAFDEFQQTWVSLDPLVAQEFSERYNNEQKLVEDVNGPALEAVNRQIDQLLHLKRQSIEPGLRQWMIRSLRDQKRDYRRAERRLIPVDGAKALPFLIYDRFIAELFRRKRQTFKSAVAINMVSSYQAAADGQLMNDDDSIPKEAKPYWKLIKDMLADLNPVVNEHPKLENVIADVLDAAEHGEKTLIFCSRTATLEFLRREIDNLWLSRMLAKWRLVYPNALAEAIFDTEIDEKRHRGRHSLLQARFHRPQDMLFLALRDSSLRTAAPIAEWAVQHLPDVVAAANKKLQSMRFGKTTAERLDYHVARICVEHVAVELWRANKGYRDFAQESGPSVVEFRDGHNGNKRPSWIISESVVKLVVEYRGSLCDLLGSEFDRIDMKRRDIVIECLARYLTYKQVSFIADLLGAAQRAGISVAVVESAALLNFLRSFWKTEVGNHWVERLRAFLEYFAERTQEQQDDILDGPIKRGDFVRDTVDQKSHARLVEAFNTPLYPEVLVANAVMQEGMDLQKNCRRVVHHDLLWNPAEIEQRIGRIDRLGSLTSRLRLKDASVMLDILYPLIRDTIDERMYRVVKTREKWLEFLLGAVPNISEYTFGDDVPQPLPSRLAKELAIDLGPDHRREEYEAVA